ncbi:MAG: cadherin-like beta sandwich domain-containing protein [Lachnospiraceae bacterium]|nr:cadherin-like beta sandwich domain-containing protein [Lachnospiraceae bacterium]
MKRRWMALWMICCVLVIGVYSGKIVHASSAALAFSKNKEQISVGQSFIVTLTVESAAEFKDFRTYVAYDPQILELVDTGNHVTGSDGLVFISDIDGKKSNVHQYRMKFRALQEGSCEIYISDTVYIYEAATATEMSVSKGTLQVDVKPAETKEENQGLGSLKVGEGVLEPKFDSKVTEYRVAVSADTETLFIDAKAKLKAYKVTMEGNTNLKEGDNLAKIVVTDKNGVDKIYTIMIHKKTKEEEALDKEVKESEVKGEEKQNGLSVYKEDDGIILETNMYFRIVPIPGSSVIPKGYKEENIKIHGMSITVYMPTNDPASNLVLIYGKVEGTKQEGAVFYTFDRMEETLQRFRASEPVVESSTETENYKKQMKHLYILIFVLIICLLVMLLALLHVYIKTDQQGEFEQEEEEEDKHEPWM